MVYDIVQFKEYLWDYVSKEAIDDDFWYSNRDYIKEVTSELYRLFKTIKGDSQNEIEQHKIIKKLGICIDSAILGTVFDYIYFNKVKEILRICEV